MNGYRAKGLYRAGTRRPSIVGSLGGRAITLTLLLLYVR